MWHMTCDMSHMGVENIDSKFQGPDSNDLWLMIFWRYGEKGWVSDLNNEWKSKVFVEQPRLHRAVY